MPQDALRLSAFALGIVPRDIVFDEGIPQRPLDLACAGGILQRPLKLACETIRHDVSPMNGPNPAAHASGRDAGSALGLAVCNPPGHPSIQCKTSRWVRTSSFRAGATQQAHLLDDLHGQL